MATPKEWDISAVIKNDAKRLNILSALKDYDDGNFSRIEGFSQAVDILKRFDEIKYLEDLLPAITFFAVHWNFLSRETRQAFGLDS